MQASEGEQIERRESPRVRLQLRLAVVYPERDGRPVLPTYHAVTHDIGLTGLSMVVEDDVFYEGEVTVVLALPPEHSWAAQASITVNARMTYAIHSSKFNGFKVGMRFVGFKDNAKELLQAAILHESAKTAVDDPHAGRSA